MEPRRRIALLDGEFVSQPEARIQLREAQRRELPTQHRPLRGSATASWPGPNSASNAEEQPSEAHLPFQQCAPPPPRPGQPGARCQRREALAETQTPRPGARPSATASGQASQSEAKGSEMRNPSPAVLPSERVLGSATASGRLWARPEVSDERRGSRSSHDLAILDPYLAE